MICPLLEITTVIGNTAALPIERLHFQPSKLSFASGPKHKYASDVFMTRLNKYPFNDAILDG